MRAIVRQHYGGPEQLAIYCLSFGYEHAESGATSKVLMGYPRIFAQWLARIPLVKSWNG
jgi:hypothetical protein